ncbi:hypothetical protein EJB05_26787, partial [Eragrostis curvula]
MAATAFSANFLCWVCSFQLLAGDSPSRFREQGVIKGEHWALSHPKFLEFVLPVLVSFCGVCSSPAIVMSTGDKLAGDVPAAAIGTLGTKQDEYGALAGDQLHHDDKVFHERVEEGAIVPFTAVHQYQDDNEEEVLMEDITDGFDEEDGASEEDVEDDVLEFNLDELESQARNVGFFNVNGLFSEMRKAWLPRQRIHRKVLHDNLFVL